VQTQVDRIGAQPGARRSRRRGVFAGQAQGGVGRLHGQAEELGERRFDRLRRQLLPPTAREQRAQPRAREVGKSILLVGFGPDEFGNDKSEVHADSAARTILDGRRGRSLRPAWR